MKKFTFLTFAVLATATCAAAPVVKTLKASATAHQHTLDQSEYTVLDQTTNLLVHPNAKAKVFKQAETISRADEGTADTNDEITPAATPLYLYPTGTFFPIIHFDAPSEENGTTVMDNYYMRLGRVLIPSNKNMTFSNVSYISNDEGIFLAGEKDQSYKWTYYFGIYNRGEGLFYDESTDYNLTAPITPTAALYDAQVRMPALEANDQAFIHTFTQGQSRYYTSLNAGGTGSLNPGLKKSYEDEDGYCNFTDAVRLSNYNTNSWGYINQVISAGNAESNGVFSNGSPAAIRDESIKSVLEEEGLATDQFFGIGQYFYTADNIAILSSIKFGAYVECEANQEVNIQLYHVGESTLQLMYDGIYTFEERVSDFTDISLDIFDEETEQDYITLPANGTYLILISGINDFGVFMPTMTKQDVTRSGLTQESAERALYGASYFLAYLDEKGALVPVDVDFNWNNQGKTEFYFNIDFELGLSYPFITPQYVYLGNGMATFCELGSQEVDAVYFDQPVGNNTVKVAQVVFLSEASAEDLMKSITFSPESLKDNLNFNILEGNDIAASGYNKTSSVRNIQFTPLAEHPEGTITLDNYGEKLIINVPAYDMSGIGDVVADGEAVATEYFDLQGRKLAGEANGIVIKKMTMADGSVKAVKVVK